MKRTPINTWLEESDSTATPLPRSNPDTRRKVKIALGVVGAIAGVSLVIFGATTLLSGDTEIQGSTQHHNSPAQAPSTIDTSAAGSVLSCQETSSEDRTESSGMGDLSRPEGLIVAYEHAFFAGRDAARMVSMSVPSAAVATEEQLAASIKNLPVDSPWCVTITPVSEVDNFDVAVRFVEADGVTVTTWNQTMTVTQDNDGAWKIVSVRGR